MHLSQRLTPLLFSYFVTTGTCLLGYVLYRLTGSSFLPYVTGVLVLQVMANLFWRALGDLHRFAAESPEAESCV